MRPDGHSHRGPGCERWRLGNQLLGRYLIDHTDQRLGSKNHPWTPCQTLPAEDFVDTSIPFTLIAEPEFVTVLI